MPVLFGFSLKIVPAVNLSTGFVLQNINFSVKTCRHDKWFLQCQREMMSSFTSLVAVAVKALTIGRLGIE